MAKSVASSITQLFLSAALYKRNQGRLVRGLTAAGFGIVAAAGCYKLSEVLEVSFNSRSNALAISGALLAVCGWLVFRLVNWEPFAEFLISVESEMQKVSWPSRTEQYRAVAVVLATMLFMVIVLFVYDTTLWWLLTTLRVLKA